MKRISKKLKKILKKKKKKKKKFNLGSRDLYGGRKKNKLPNMRDLYVYATIHPAKKKIVLIFF